VAELEIAYFCLSSSLLSALFADLLLVGEESSLSPPPLFCGECISLIRNVNRLHDLLTQLTDQLKGTLRKIQRRVRADDVTASASERDQRRRESKRSAAVEVTELKVEVKEEVIDSQELM